MFLMRFDMRAPGFGAAGSRELYEAALDIAAWGDEHGCMQIVISEHHGSDDGYLPSPLILASAMAARTRSTPIQVGALIVPLHDPLRLAEDIAILDNLSGGRVSYIAAVGYVESEFAMFGQPFRERGRRMDESLEAMRAAWTGEPFDYQGRRVCVRPKPATPGGPMLLMGGNSRIAARRAARFDLGMCTQGVDPNFELVYREEFEKLGKEPKLCINPPQGLAMSVFISEDPDRAWRDYGPYLLHDAKSYAAWMGDVASANHSTAQTVDELRLQAGAYRIFTPDEALEYVRMNGVLLLQPLCGGLPPDLAWRNLELLETKVLPRMNAG